MQTYELVMIYAIVMTMFVGQPAALYSSRPAAVLEYALRHSRYRGPGLPNRLGDPTGANHQVVGNQPVTAVAGYQGQSTLALGFGGEQNTRNQGWY